MKKILFLNTTKLAVLSAALLLAVFCTIGMSFTPAEEGENIGNPNDTTYVTGPRRSHWTTDGSCGSTNYNNKTDYAEVHAQVIVWDNNGDPITNNPSEYGSVTLSGTPIGGSATDGTTYSATISATKPETNPIKAVNLNGSSVSIEWNSGVWTDNTNYSGDNSIIIKNRHTLNVAVKANVAPESGYEFYGWTKVEGWDGNTTPTTKPTTLYKDNPEFEESVVIGGGGPGFEKYGTKNESYQSEGSPYRVMYYAHFAPPEPQTIILKATENGTYTYSDGSSSGTISNNNKEGSITTSKQITLTATPASGYKFFGWYEKEKEGDKEKYLSYESPWSKKFTVSTAIYAKFIPDDAALFIIKDDPDKKQFWNLSEACTEAQSSSKVVLPKADGTLYPLVDGELCKKPEGKTITPDTIPSGVTLLIPYEGGANFYTEFQNDMLVHATWAKPTCFRKLTLYKKCTIVVEGNLNVAASIYSVDGGKLGSGAPKVYGQIDMQSGSNITIKENAKLYCWGFITGAEGFVEIEERGTVCESLQIQHHPGGSEATKWMLNKKALFLNQYYVQNIESTLRINTGAIEKVYATMYVQSIRKTNATFIGSTTDRDALFQLNGGYLIRKYDSQKDRIIYDFYGDFKFNYLSLRLASTIDIETTSYPLPVTNNMTVNCYPDPETNKAEMTFEYDVALLPGTEILIDENVTTNVSGSMFAYDIEAWKDKGYAGFSTNVTPVQFSPTCTYKRTIADLKDARVELNGTLNIKHGGLINTTTGSVDSTKYGADVCSSGGGVIKFETRSATEKTYQYASNSLGSAIEIQVTAAQLHNDTTKNPKYHYTQTDKARAGDVFTYNETYGRWRCERTITWDANGGTIEPTTTIVGRGEPLSLYFPESLPIPTKTGYTFNGWFTAASDGKQITTDTIVNDNVDYYAQWTANKYTITWYPNNGEDLMYSTYTYDGEQVDLPTTPTREGYTFNGWFTAETGGTQITEIGNTNKPTSDVTYYAQWTANNYTITWYPNNGEDLMYSTYTYDGEQVDLPTTPTREGYTFNGWFTAETGGTQITEIGNTNKPTSNVTYYAQWTFVPSGDLLDIVDADNTKDSLTINTNGWASSGWPYTVNGVKYKKGDRKADRTLVIPYSGQPDDDMLIEVKDKEGTVVSSHIYKVPFVYPDTDTEKMSENSIVFVKSDTLTVGDASAKEIYVAPGAALQVNENGTLDVKKLVLRTTPFEAAILTNKGTIAGQVYYSRIARDTDFHLFAIPAGSNTADVVLSDGTSAAVASTVAPYGNAWQLREYNTARRAEVGDDGANWNNIGWDNIVVNGDTRDTTYSDVAIEASKGYELRSGSKYYREYLFPVTLPTTATSVQVTDITSEAGAVAGAAHAGWNIICSPYTYIYTSEYNDPARGIKVSWQKQELDGSYSYIQVQPDQIKPAVPFAYQTKENGSLNFSADSLFFKAPRKQSAAEALTETEWIHLDIYDAYGEGDETSLFVHPTRFEQTYKTGIDVAKQSLTAARPIIYSTHAYGDMAFAGVADSLLENGIDIAVYSPAAQELTFSLRENKFLHRLEYLWLADNETGERTDLLMDDYTCRANAGTIKGRFVLNGRFKAPQISTGLGNTQTDYNIYAIGNNIAISGVEQGTPIYVFDAVGHMIYTTAATSDEVIVPAPCAGVYMLSVGGQTAKLVVNQ